MFDKVKASHIASKVEEASRRLRAAEGPEELFAAGLRLQDALNDIGAILIAEVQQDMAMVSHVLHAGAGKDSHLN